MKLTSSLFVFTMCSVSAVAAAFQDDSEERVEVVVVGQLRAGIVAIGGETTGVTVSSRKMTFELDFGQNLQQKKQSEALNGKKVKVQGSLERRTGVEIKDRWIISVSSLKAAAASSAPRKSTSLFRAKARRPDTQMHFIQQERAAVVDIQSEFGIDQAILERTAATWPDTIFVRLHLKGLESFKVSNGKQTVNWAAAATSEQTRVVWIENGTEQQLDSSSPFWTAVQVVADSKSIPLKEGYFEVRMPDQLFSDNPERLTLAWVDFYRT